jgi:hypothetical protein
LVQVLEDGQTNYELRSSVLGGAVILRLAAYQQTAAVPERNIYAGGTRIAKGRTYEHHNPVTGSWVTTNYNVAPYYNGYYWLYLDRFVNREERDPTGGDLPLQAPDYPNYPTQNWQQPLFIEGGDPFDYSSGYSLDGLPVSRAELNRINGRGELDLLANIASIGGKQFAGYTVSDFNGRLVAQTWDWETARQQAIRYETFTVTRNWVGNWTTFITPVSQQKRTIGKPPELLFVDKSQQERFNAAWEGLDAVLQNPECAKFLGGWDKILKAIQEVGFFKVEGGTPVPIEGTIDGKLQVIAYKQTHAEYSSDDDTITLFSKGGFFANGGKLTATNGDSVPVAFDVKIKGKVQPFARASDVDNAVFALLHELAHKLNAIKSGDGGSTDRQGENNAELLKKCFPSVWKELNK